MKKNVLFVFLLIFIFTSLFTLTPTELAEEEGLSFSHQNGCKSNRTLRDIPEGGLLLIPDSGADRVMAFDPTTGDLFDADFIPSDPINLSTPIAAALHPDGNSILVSDQIEDGLLQYDLDGNFMGWFAPAGGVNNSILDNVRGWGMKADGNILVTTASGTNSDAIVEFDTAGNHIGNFIAPNATIMDGPFCIVYRDVQDDYLVTASASDNVHQYDNAGNYIGDLVTGLDFLEQLSITPSGNLLIAAFSAPSGCYEYTNDGTLVGYYGILPSLRGVYELPNGNILVTNGAGVYEIDRNNTIVSTKIEGVNARFIYFVGGGETGIVQGNVTNIDTGSAIEGVSIMVGSYTTETGVDGYYSLTIAPGTYDWTCSIEGYEETGDSITIAADEVITLDIALQHLYDPPESLTYQFIEPDVILEWIEPVCPDLTGYNIYRDDVLIANVTEYEYTDLSVPTGTHMYYVTAVYGNYESIPSNQVEVEVVPAGNIMPVIGIALHANIPNPFNPTTVISFSLENADHVNIEIFNVKGEKVCTLVDGEFEASTHSVVWNGRDDLGRTTTSGVYFYKMRTSSFTSTKKMVLIK